MRRGTFARLLLAELGAPAKTHNLRALQAQMQAEGGNAKNNPFNTTQPMPGSTDYNSVGVQNYTSPQQGLEATVKTLRSRSHGYGFVIEALRLNKPARVTLDLIGRSSWGTAPDLLVEVLAWIAQVPGVLKLLENKQIAN